MDRIHIEGGYPLNGRIPISGAKNSALKLQAAALLTDEELILLNMPNLADTRFFCDLLCSLGEDVDWPIGSARARMRFAKIQSTFAPYDLVRKMRASFNVLGPLLARMGEAKVSLPGGCAIGARPVDLHLKALEALGATIRLEDGYVLASAPNGLRGAQIVFPFVSVGATEHTMLSAVLASGHTRIENAAREPEIIDIAKCLNQMGAKVSGAGTTTIDIEGVSRLHGTTYSVLPDRIEAGTFAIAVAATGGDVLLEGARAEHLTSLLQTLRESGCSCEGCEAGIRIAREPGRPRAVDMETRPFPGFPTDLQAQFMAYMCQAQGTSVIRETIFENRFMHAPELMRMGADIQVHGNEAVVRGIGSLTGAPVMATDLRASVSLVVAGLAGKGQTSVNRVYHLDRGFERLEDKLRQCGARISRQN